MSPRKRNGLSFQFRLEQLEPRAMLASHGGVLDGMRDFGAMSEVAVPHRGGTATSAQSSGSTFSTPQATISQSTVTTAATNHSSAIQSTGFTVSPIASSHDSLVERTELRTELTDATTGAAGTIVANTETKNGETETRLTVRVTGADPRSTLGILLDGNVVGQVRTNSRGFGTAVIRNIDADPVDGVSVGVGDLTGTLDLTHSHSESAVVGRLTVAPEGESAVVLALTEKNDGETETKLLVRVTGADPGVPLDVSIDGNVVGQVTPNSRGTGVAFLRNLDAAVTESSTIEVGDLSGELVSGPACGRTSPRSAPTCRIRPVRLRPSSSRH